MTLKGHYRNGQIVLDDPVDLKEGTPVTVNVATPEPEPTDAEARAFWQGLLQFAGKAKGLPADFAENHDHYIHGAPKRERGQ